MPEETPVAAAENEFWVLRAVAHIERGIGALLTIAGFVLVLTTLQNSWDIPEAWAKALGTLVLGIATFAFGEVILLFLKIEKNTRR